VREEKAGTLYPILRQVCYGYPERMKDLFFPNRYWDAKKRILVFGKPDNAERDFFLLSPMGIPGNQDRPGRKFNACFGEE